MIHFVGKWQLMIISIAFTPLIVSYTVEILPYSIRAKGFNIFNFAVSLSLIFNQYVNPVALGKINWKYYVMLSHQSQFDLLISHIFPLLDCILLLDRLRTSLLLLVRYRDEESYAGRDGRSI